MRLCFRLLAKQLERAVGNETKERRALKIAIIGTPNVGKSALTNKLIKADVCAVSKLIDTTRQNMTTSLSEDEFQLIVVDSPGLIGLKHAKEVINTHTESKILLDPEAALNKAEHVIVVDDVTSPGEYIHHRVLHLLHRNPHITSSLVMNKCDLVKQRSDLLRRGHILTCGKIGGKSITTEQPRLGKLGKLTQAEPKTFALNSMENRLDEKDPKWVEAYNRVINKPTHKCSWGETKQVFRSEPGWPHFSGLFFVSAKTGDGIDELRSHLKSLSVPVGKWKFGPNLKTTKKRFFIVAEHIRSALLNSVPSDIAYKLVIKIVHFEVDEEEIRIIADVICEKERWGKMVSAALEEQVPRLEDKFKKLFGLDVLLEVVARFEGKPIVVE
ncbi:G domain-containing protein [Aphelenchoides bicaudatus]|nr:G domain-containing protein [Aphelenchoides bicaudatus]